MPRALTVEDATVLKLTLFALLERYSTYKRSDLNEMNSQAPTPSVPADDVMEAINRVRVDGKVVVRTERTMRMQQLIGMPVPEDEREEHTEEGVDRTTIDRLAASIEIIEPAESLH